MRTQPLAKPSRHTAAIATAIVLASALGAVGGVLGGCGTKEGNGGIPTLTVQPPSDTSTPTVSGSPTASPSISPGDGQGARLFAANCSSCHGDSGQGDIGPSLTPLTERDLQKIVGQITNGGAGMPSFKGELTGAQIEALARFVAGLQ
jgi:cytochrome c551